MTLALGPDDEDEAETGTLPEAGKAVSFVLCPIDESTVDVNPSSNVDVDDATGGASEKPTPAVSEQEMTLVAMGTHVLAKSHPHW